MQNVHGTAHSHENWTNGFASADLCHQLARDVGGSKVGEDQDIGATLQRAEGIGLLDDFRRQCLVGHDLSIHDQGWICELQQFHRFSNLGADGMIDAAETGE